MRSTRSGALATTLTTLALLAACSSAGAGGVAGGVDSGPPTTPAPDAAVAASAPDAGQEAGSTEWTDGGGTDSGQPPKGFTLGGTVTGVSGSGLVLQDGAGDPLAVASDGPFVFPGLIPSGTPYGVHVVSAPHGQACAVVARDSGTVTATISNVAVACFAPTTTCKTLHEAQPGAPSGVYAIHPADTTFNAYCDMTRDGGGWTRAANLRPDSNFQGDRTGALGDVSSADQSAKLDDALITSMNTAGYFRFECGATFDGFVRNDQNVWSSARSSSLSWSIDPTRTGVFSCPATRDGYVFGTNEGTSAACDAAVTSYVSSDGAAEGGGCYVKGEGWGRFGNLWVK